jgi:beta-glucanase (GH16 family)
VETAPTPPAEWTLVFEDGFDGPNGNQPDRGRWTYEHGFVRNAEEQYYTDSTNNIFFRDGNLVIRAVRDESANPQITSASIHTANTYTYGRFEARVKVPGGRGIWPAFWLLGDDHDTAGWPWCGEIDVMEFLGYDPNQVHSSLHNTARNGLLGNQVTASTHIDDLTSKFLVYALEWSPTSLDLYVESGNVLVNVASYQHDGKCSEITWPFNKPFQVKINLAVGGYLGGQQGVDYSIFPAEYQIDWVRIYRKTAGNAEPACDKRRYHGLVDSASGFRLNDVNTKLMTQPDAQAAFVSKFAEGVAAAMGQSATSEGFQRAFMFDAIVPYETNGKVRILANFTLVNVDHSAAQSALAAGMSSFGSFTSWLSGVVGSSWTMVSVGTDCPGCYTGSGVPVPRPFAAYTIPATVPISAYDFGGFRVAYYDVTGWDQYNAQYGRSGLDYTDLAPVGDGSFALGYTEVNEWLVYSGITTPSCSGGTMSVKVAVNAGNPFEQTGTIRVGFHSISAGGDVGSGPVAMVSVKTTGRFYPFDQSESTTVQLACGTTYRAHMSFVQGSYFVGSLALSTA